MSYILAESSRCVSLSGSGSTDSERATRADSVDDSQTDSQRWPRQNSVRFSNNNNIVYYHKYFSVSETKLTRKSRLKTLTSIKYESQTRCF